jgi:hypothetical protein
MIGTLELPSAKQAPASYAPAPKPHVKRKIALVIPPSPFLMDERVFVSLGILKVASALEASIFQAWRISPRPSRPIWP